MKFTLAFLCASLALCQAWQEQGVVRMTPESAINIKLFYDSYNTFATYPMSQMSSMFNDVRFKRNSQTMVFFHGLDGHVLDTSTRAVVEAMMRNGSYNVVVFDWSYYIEGVSFPTVVPDLLKISEITATYFNEIFPMYSVKNFYFVGFSLGAQLAGMISRMAYRKSGNQYMFPRITALDPVLPMPYVPFIRDLNENDAEFVDIIHTDSSSSRIMGSVNFFPNGGSNQPSCNSTTTGTTNNNGETYMPDTMVAFFDDNCSHNKAWKYFAQGVENKRFFTAKKCDSFTDYMTGRCDSNQLPGKMGFFAETNMRGNYYLQTREEDEMIARNLNNRNNRFASSSSSSSSDSKSSESSSASSEEQTTRRRN